MNVMVGILPSGPGDHLNDGHGPGDHLDDGHGFVPVGDLYGHGLVPVGDLCGHGLCASW